ncbi:8667_t:CDS:2 [Rhizophagus irregularis]|nr:8667_t:CDS:2 [Rhizophagus irregularis]
MENNGECSQKRGKNKLVDHIDHGEVANNEKETTPLKPIKQLKQITLNFPSITNNIQSDDDECSDDEYNAVPRDGEPHMCPKEKKLRRHKYFSRLINPKHIRCICGKDLKLDKRYSVKNLKIHVRSKKACNAKIQGQHSVEKYFKSSSDEIPLSMQFPCQGLSNDQIKHYILHCPSDFGGSKRETELACQLFPQKFKDGHLVYSKLNSDERQELYSLQRAHATWFLDQGNLSVTSAKCKKFTARESKICEECDKLRNNSRFRDAISMQRATEKTFKYIPKRHIQDNRLVQLLGDDKLKTLYGNAIDEESDKCNMWTKLAEYGKKGAFKTNKTFSELVELMLQIKKIQEQGKSKRAVRYSEHLHHFFSLLSDSSREYGIFRKIWPSDDDINDAIRIASENAKEFSNFLQMKKQSKNTSYTDPLIPELSETNTNNLLTNEVVPQNITIDQVADELNRISQLENVFDDYFENNDISDNSRHEYSEDLLEINTADADNFIMKTEINYIINNPKTTVLQELNHEPEEKIFEKEGSCDIFLMLELRRSHEAFSRSDRPRGIQTRISVNLNQGSQDKIDRNLANHLVNQLSNNQDHQIMRSRTQRWKGRNQLQSLVNSNKMQVTNIGCANVSQAHPLKKDGYLLVFTDGRLCIAKVIAMYQMIAGGRLYAHLKSKDIVYYFGANVPFILHSNSLLTLDDNSLEIYSFFKKEETQLHLASIFDNRDINCEQVDAMIKEVTATL